MSTNQLRENCYLCGATTELTHDHIPPKGFFPKPRPGNLITVLCCRTCNHGWSIEDEAIRAFLALSIGRSEAGDNIWEERVIPGTVARSPRFQEYMIGRTSELTLPTPSGSITLPAFEIPQDRIERFMARITKGFLRNYYPDYDYTNDAFTVRCIDPTEQFLQIIEERFVGTKYDERGDGVIRYRHGISDTGTSGLWLYIFYDAVWFLVHHAHSSVGTQVTQHQQVPV